MAEVRHALASAIRLRCPHCGTGKVMRGILLRERCDTCGLRFERTDDNYFGGAVFFGLFCGELVVAFALLITVLLTWPHVPWDGLLYAIVIGSLAALPVSLPLAKVVWLHVDTLVRPVQPDELTPSSAGSTA
jgi:uncharacterized protein (DUF983 family)